jgi:alpha/beta superfamily hydrolase
MSTHAARPAQAEPIYFGPAGSLFGVFHAPARPRARRGAIVLCHPVGHEYFRVHRAFRNVAVGLSRAGFSVLRFDYYGTGDSHGESSAATLSRWQADVGAAIDEVKRRAALPRASVVGLRLGATIAWLECQRRTDMELLVMWEPVASGAEYLDQQRQLEHRWLTDPSRRAPADAELRESSVLGLPLSAGTERELRAVDLAASPLPVTAHVVTLTAAADAPLDAAWRERLTTRYGATSLAVLPSGADWNDPATVHTAVYAGAAVQALPAMFDKVLV